MMVGGGGRDLPQPSQFRRHEPRKRRRGGGKGEADDSPKGAEGVDLRAKLSRKQ